MPVHIESVWRPGHIIDTPRRTAPPSPAARRARRSASSDCRMIERASSTSSAPAGVTLTPECERSNSVMPNSASKPDTCLTSAGVDTRNFAAAREKLPSSAAADMASSRRSYTSISRFRACDRMVPQGVVLAVHALN